MEVQEARIKKALEEIDYLKARLESPQDLQAKLSLIETVYRKEKEQLERDLQKAKEEGNTAVEREKKEKLNLFVNMAVENAKIQRELAEYKLADEEREIKRKALHELLQKSRLIDYLDSNKTFTFTESADALRDMFKNVGTKGTEGNK